MSNPVVSVVMPLFDRRKTAARAIRSVLNQEDVDFEFIVVDDASPYPAIELFDEVHRGGHQVLRLSENRGPGAARNEGCRLAKGKWLAFLDSDDYWSPKKLHDHLVSLEESGLSIGQTSEIWYRNGEQVNPPKAHRISGGDLFRRSLRAVCVSSSSVVLKRSLFQAYGGFDENFFVCEDYDLWLRISASEEFDFCPAPLVTKFGGHSDQLSKALPAMDRFRILSILKLLNDGALQSQAIWAQQCELTLFELSRKLRILSKGSAKRGMSEVVNLCSKIAINVDDRDFAEALTLSRALVDKWPVRP